MGFLRHLRGGNAAPEKGLTPYWALPLTLAEFRQFMALVSKEIPEMPGPAILRDPEVARRYGLHNWIPVLSRTPAERWPELIHATFEQERFVAAGEEIEKRSQTFEAAREFLRVHWLMRGREPLGDVAVDGPAPDTLEVLCLDAGRSIRHVSRQLLEKWGVSAGEAASVARARVLELPIERLDLSNHDHPAIHVLSLESEGPYAGVLLSELERLEPAAIGTFGTLVGAVTPSALILRALDPSPQLRGDLATLSLFIVQVLANKPKETLFELPLWRRRDGSLSQVAFTLDDGNTVLDSYDPAFAGVLAALDPREELTAPDWARARGMSDRQYTRFAGCVAVSAGVKVTDVAGMDSGLLLAGLAETCRSEPFERWPGLVATRVGDALAHIYTARAAAEHAADDPDAARSRLVTWLDFGERGSDAVVRPLANTGYVEVLGIHADASTTLAASEAERLGARDELFERAEAAIRATLAVRAEPMPFVSGEAFQVTGYPSASAAIAHICEWLPDLAGPYGVLAAIGDRDADVIVLPIHDATALLDLPSLLGAAAGASMRASWPIAPAVFWVGPGGLAALRAEPRDGAVAGVVPSADLGTLAATLPAEPRSMPPGLTEILGSEGARRLLGITHAVMLDWLTRGTSFEITAAVLRDLARSCVERPSAEWPAIIRDAFEDGTAWSEKLSALSTSSDYTQVAPALVLRLAREGLSGSGLAAHVGGGIDAYPVLHVGVRGTGGRSRRVTTEMLARWNVDAERCRRDAGANLAADAALCDEPMYPDAPWLRELRAGGEECEAVGLYLHLWRPGTKRGFLVAIAHPACVYYAALDDERTFRSIPTFARVIAGTYRNADEADDALSPWLLWLTADGRVVPLFDVRQPVPPPNQLPAEFRRLIAGAARVS